MSAIVVCLDCPNYQNGGYCRLKHKDVGALSPACDPAERMTRTEKQAAARDKAEKTCPRCGKALPMEEFANHSTNLDGKQTYCRKCQAEAYARWAEKNLKKNRKSLTKEAEQMETTGNTMSHKTCPKCGRSLPLEAYGKHSGQKDGLQQTCKECRAAAYKAKKEKQQEQQQTETKRCPKCGRDLPKSAFGHKAEAKDGLQSWCNDCRAGKTQEAPQQKTVVVRETLTDKQMVDLLREHGWIVTCTRTITEEL